MQAAAHEPIDGRIEEVSEGGLLFVGHSENFSAQSDLFALRGKTVYERLAERSAREPECIR